jgi:Phage tail assembly chaperone protein
MYYVKFAEDGFQAETMLAEELPGDGWYPAGEEITGKFFKLVDGLPQVLTEEEFEERLSYLQRKSTFDVARLRRNEALSASDWTQLPNSPLSDEKKAQWEAYREALRNYPALLESNINAQFPAEPQ